MVGRDEDAVWVEEGCSFVTGGCEQAAQRASTARIGTTIRRVRKRVLSSHRAGSGGGQQHKLIRRKRSSIAESRVYSGPAPDSRSGRGQGPRPCRRRRAERARSLQGTRERPTGGGKGARESGKAQGNEKVVQSCAPLTQRQSIGESASVAVDCRQTGAFSNAELLCRCGDWRGRVSRQIPFHRGGPLIFQAPARRLRRGAAAQLFLRERQLLYRKW